MKFREFEVELYFEKDCEFLVISQVKFDGKKIYKENVVIELHQANYLIKAIKELLY